MFEEAISSTRLYRVYCGMKNRCYNKNSAHYERYGGRGISICDEWLGDNGVQNFISWSLSHNYNDTLSIDRIDNDGNYSPENCQWITRSLNSAKGNTKIIPSDGFDTRTSKSSFPKDNISLRYALKGIIAEQGFTLTQVNDELNRRHGTSLGLQNFSNRLRKESFSYLEVVEILDVIGYRVEWKLKQ